MFDRPNQTIDLHIDRLLWLIFELEEVVQSRCE